MDGVSATWALTVFHEADIDRNEHWRIREMMAAENDGLHARVTQLEEKIALMEDWLSRKPARQINLVLAFFVDYDFYRQAQCRPWALLFSDHKARSQHVFD